MRCSLLLLGLATALGKSKPTSGTYVTGFYDTKRSVEENADFLLILTLFFFHSLAYAEMRLILAKIIWNFDFKLADPYEDWIGTTKSYAIWEKQPLMVHLYPRKRRE